jgi:hypothetical protein
MSEPQMQHKGEPHTDHHGQSVASWTAVGIIILGALVMGIAVVVTETWLFIVGVVVVALGALAGKLLSALGFGAPGKQGH